MIIKQIKIICTDQPLRFHTKNLIITVVLLTIKFVCVHFILIINFDNKIVLRR